MWKAIHVLLFAVAMVAVTSVASASIVSVEVAGVGPLTYQLNPGSPYPGDTVTLSASAAAFDVDVPTGAPVFIQLGNFHLDYSADASMPGEGVFSDVLTRAVTINGVSHDVSQDLTLEIAADQDTLTLSESAPTSYFLPELGTVTLTAHGVVIPSGSLGDHYFDVNGTFELAAEGGSVVPEPATIIIWSLFGGLGIAVGWSRRKRAA